jgi:hypothetical protein
MKLSSLLDHQGLLKTATTNFDDDDMVSLNEAPPIKLHLRAKRPMPTSRVALTVSVIASAVHDAILVAKEKPLRRVPIRAKELV